jgi:hypothetical protein
MYREHRVLHHFDVPAGAWIYRVFLLPSTLQVDLAFVPATEFRALAPSFQLVFGAANQARHTPDSPPKEMIGLGWLYALHARSCIARRKFWQAEYMISGIRDTALALACLRHSLPAVHGRGMDLLPGKVTAPFEETLVRHLDASELSRAFRAVTRLILDEIQSVDRELAERLQPALMRMAAIPRE